MVYRFGDRLLDTQRHTLYRAGQPVRRRAKAFQVLLYLLEHRDRTVLKQELYEQVWPQQFISEATLESTVRAVRQAIGDSGRAQQLIQTVYGYGYRFIAAVEACADVAPGGPAKPCCLFPTPPQHPHRTPPLRGSGSSHAQSRRGVDEQAAVRQAFEMRGSLHPRRLRPSSPRSARRCRPLCGSRSQSPCWPSSSRFPGRRRTRLPPTSPTRRRAVGSRPSWRRCRGSAGRATAALAVATAGGVWDSPDAGAAAAARGAGGSRAAAAGRRGR